MHYSSLDCTDSVRNDSDLEKEKWYSLAAVYISMREVADHCVSQWLSFRRSLCLMTRSSQKLKARLWEAYLTCEMLRLSWYIYRSKYLRSCDCASDCSVRSSPSCERGWSYFYRLQYPVVAPAWSLMKRLFGLGWNGWWLRRRNWRPQPLSISIQLSQSAAGYKCVFFYNTSKYNEVIRLMKTLYLMADNTICPSREEAVASKPGCVAKSISS